MHASSNSSESTDIAEAITTILLGTAIALSIPAAAFFIFLKVLENAFRNVC